MNSSIQNNQEIVDMFNTAEVVDKSTMYLLVPRIKQADDNSKRKPKQMRRPNALNQPNSLRRLIFPERNEQVHCASDLTSWPWHYFPRNLSS